MTVEERSDMPQQAWIDKRERQYEHIKQSARERGEDEDTAEEIAARTVNKERARAGEAKESSRTSTEDIRPLPSDADSDSRRQLEGVGRSLPRQYGPHPAWCEPRSPPSPTRGEVTGAS